jgi:hypothetical protein
MKNSLKNTLFAGAALALSAMAPVHAAQTADVLFVVDESGSMGGEHAWLTSMVSQLDSALNTAGVTGNRFGLVGYGNGNASEVYGHTVGAFGDASAFATATSSLITSGGTEDGYAGMDYAFSNFNVRGNAALNVILVTDEDRDNRTANTYQSILGAFTGKKALLNAVVNARFTGDAIGTSSKKSYKADGLGGFTTSAGQAAVTFDSGTTKEDYVDLALATGGAAWNLNLLRSGGNSALSFTKAFIDIKVAEIKTQIPTNNVPVPAAAFLFAPAMLGFLGLRRKAKLKTA